MSSVSVSEPSSSHRDNNTVDNGEDGNSSNNDHKDRDDAQPINRSATTDTCSVMTMEEVVDAIGFGNFHRKLMLLCGVGYFAEITELVVVSFVAPSIQRQMGLTNTQYGLLGSSSFVGMAVGAFFWGYVSDHMGRQLSFAMTVWLTFFGGFFSGLAPNYAVLLFLRFTAAFGIGGMLPVDYTVFLEFLPSQKRGSYIVLVDAIGVVPALTLSATIAWYFAGAEHVQWRWVLLISSIPVGVMGVLRRHVPESPRYHLAAGETDKAQRVVQAVADHNEVHLPNNWRLLSFEEEVEQQKQEGRRCLDEIHSDTTGHNETNCSRVGVSPLSTHATSPWNATRQTATPQHQSIYSAVPAQNPECEMVLCGSCEGSPAPPARGQTSLSSSPPQQQGTTSYQNDGNGGESPVLVVGGSAGEHSFQELVSDPDLARITYRLWMCYFCVQLSSAGMVFALPKLFDEIFQGKSGEYVFVLE